MNVCTLSQVPFCEYNVYLSTIALCAITMCLCVGRSPGDPSYYVEDMEIYHALHRYLTNSDRQTDRQLTLIDRYSSPTDLINCMPACLQSTYCHMISLD